MTDTNTITEDTEPAAPAATSTDAADNPATGTDTPGEAENGSQPESDPSGDDDAEPRGRAAQYRKRAQDAEAKVAEVEAHSAELAATIERLQRIHVEQAIAETGLKPAAVYAVAQLGDLVGDDGLPDQSKLEAAVKAAKEQLGAAPPPPLLRREMGMRSGAAGHPQPKKDGWAAAFARRDD